MVQNIPPRRSRTLSSWQKSPFQERGLFPKKERSGSNTEENTMQTLLGQPIEIKPQFVLGSGQCPLALYPLLPDFNPEKVIIHYHEAGAYQCEQALQLASHLVDDHNIAVYLVELRGHGLSAGTTLSKELNHPNDLLEDIDSVLTHVKQTHPEATLYLSAHGLTCTLLSHYSLKGKKRDLFSGLLFLAPYFGPFADLYESSSAFSKAFFEKIHFGNLLVHALSKGRLFAQKPGWALALRSDETLHPKKQRIVAKRDFSTNWAAYFHTLAPASLLGGIQHSIFIFQPENALHSDSLLKSFFSSCRAKKRWHTNCGIDRFALLDHVVKVIAHDLALSTLDVYSEEIL